MRERQYNHVRVAISVGENVRERRSVKEKECEGQQVREGGDV